MAAPRERRARGMRGGHEPQVMNGDVALVKHPPHDHADLPGRTEYRDIHSAIAYPHHIHSSS